MRAVKEEGVSIETPQTRAFFHLPEEGREGRDMSSSCDRLVSHYARAEIGSYGTYNN